MSPVDVVLDCGKRTRWDGGRALVMDDGSWMDRGATAVLGWSGASVRFGSGLQGRTLEPRFDDVERMQGQDGHHPRGGSRHRVAPLLEERSRPLRRRHRRCRRRHGAELPVSTASSSLSHAWAANRRGSPHPTPALALCASSYDATSRVASPIRLNRRKKTCCNMNLVSNVTASSLSSVSPRVRISACAC